MPACNDAMHYTDTYQIEYGTNPRAHCEHPTADAKMNAANKAKDAFVEDAKTYCHRQNDKCDEGQRCNAHVRHINVKRLRNVSEPAGSDKFNCKIEFEVSGDIVCDCGEPGGDTVDRL